MRWPFAYAAFVLALAGGTLSVPGSYNIEGNSGLTDQSILTEIRRTACSVIDSACVDSICRAIAAHYWNNGYLDAEVRCRIRRAGADTVDISIREGQVSLLRFVKMSGMAARYESAVGEIFEHQVGIPLSQAALERGIADVLAFYDARGYPLTTIHPEMVSAGEGWVGIHLHVSEGPAADIGGLVFKGLKRNSPDAVGRETGLSLGEPYDGKKVEDASQRLMSLGVFEEVSEAELTFDSRDTTVTVTMEVVEARTSSVEGAGAYFPSAEGARFVGSLDLEFRSLAGTLRRLKILWSRPGGGRLKWSVEYREPRILSRPFALDANLSSDVADTSYARRRLWLGVTYRGEPRLELGMGGFLGTTKDRAVVGGEGSFSERGLSFDLRYDTRRDPVNPASGQVLAASHQVASLEFEDDASEDRTLSGLLVDGAQLVGLGGRRVLVLGARFEGVYSSQGRIPASHRVRVGGMRSLRGYPEEWFSVEKALSVTIEVRRLLGRYSRVYSFFDGATLDDGSRSLGQVRGAPFGYGLGFLAGSRSGILRLEIALGRDDTWSEAKLHIGLVRRF